MIGAKVFDRIADFQRPPISEVVCGVSFKPLMKLDVFEAGSFWQRIRDDFPKTETSKLVYPVAPELLRSPIPPLPRMTMKSSDGCNAIQLQQNQFSFNWMKPGQNIEYPLFEKIFSGFERKWSQFASFVAERELGDISEKIFYLNYVNEIPCSGQNTLASIEGITPFIKASEFGPGRTGGNIGTFIIALILEVEGEAIEIKLQSGQSDKDETPTLLFELSTASGEGDNPNLEEWFAKARKRIVETFISITTESAHSDWGKV